MKRLLFQAVFLATGMIMGVYASGDVGLDLMCGALVAVCCAAVGEYASGSWLAMALIVMLDCGACLVPAWYLMLPIAAFNAASSSAGVDGSQPLLASVGAAMAVASSHDDSDFPFDWLARSIRLVHHHIDGAPNGSGIRCRSALHALREPRPRSAAIAGFPPRPDSPPALADRRKRRGSCVGRTHGDACRTHAHRT